MVTLQVFMSESLIQSFKLIYVETVIIFSMILSWLKGSIEQNLFETEIFSNFTNDYTRYQTIECIPAN